MNRLENMIKGKVCRMNKCSNKQGHQKVKNYLGKSEREVEERINGNKISDCKSLLTVFFFHLREVIVVKIF